MNRLAFDENPVNNRSLNVSKVRVQIHNILNFKQLRNKVTCTDFNLELMFSPLGACSRAAMQALSHGHPQFDLARQLGTCQIPRAIGVLTPTSPKSLFDGPNGFTRATYSGLDLDAAAYAPDATTIDLCLSLLPAVAIAT